MTRVVGPLVVVVLLGAFAPRATFGFGAYGEPPPLTCGLALPAESPWPIVHGAAENPGSFVSSSDDTVLGVDAADGLTIGVEQVSNEIDFLATLRPLAPVQGPSDRWWLSTLLTVSTVVETDAPPLYARESMTLRGGLLSSDDPASIGFDSSYVFVGADDVLYGTSGPSIVRFARDEETGTVFELPPIRPLSATGSSVVSISVTSNCRLAAVASRAAPQRVYKEPFSWASDGSVVASEAVLAGTTISNATRFESVDLQSELRRLAPDLAARFDGIDGLDDEFVSNSLAVVDTIAYVATAWGVATVDLAPTVPAVVDFLPMEPYFAPSDRRIMNRLGKYGSGSSPSCFFLAATASEDEHEDERAAGPFVVVTDGQVEPMHVIVAEANKDGVFSDASWSADVVFGDSPRSHSEQSVSVVSRRDGTAEIVVVNNYLGLDDRIDTEDPNVWTVYDDGAAPDLLNRMNLFAETTAEGMALLESGLFQSVHANLFSGACSAGVNLYTFRADALELAWSNVDVCSLTTIPLQTDDRVWFVGSRRTDPTTIGIVALDKTRGGELALFEPLPEIIDAENNPVNIFDVFTLLFAGSGLLRSVLNVTDSAAYTAQAAKNTWYAAMETDGDALVFGVAGGFVRAVPR